MQNDQPSIVFSRHSLNFPFDCIIEDGNMRLIFRDPNTYGDMLYSNVLKRLYYSNIRFVDLCIDNPDMFLNSINKSCNFQNLLSCLENFIPSIHRQIEILFSPEGGFKFSFIHK